MPNPGHHPGKASRLTLDVYIIMAIIDNFNLEVSALYCDAHC